MKLKLIIKFWLETENGYVFGEGAFRLLDKIQELGTLRGAAEALNMSYRHAWGIAKNIEKRIGKPILKTHKGGSLGGGGAELTEEAILLMEKYLEAREVLMEVTDKLNRNNFEKVLDG